MARFECDVRIDTLPLDRMRVTLVALECEKMMELFSPCWKGGAITNNSCLRHRMMRNLPSPPGEYIFKISAGAEIEDTKALSTSAVPMR